MKQKMVQSAMTAFLAMVTSQSSIAATTDTQVQSTEKCYGVVKAGMNDCATAKSSCASSSVKDGQTDAFILLPKGLCERLVSGALKP